MFEEGLAKRYAKALLNLAEKEDPAKIGEVEQELFNITRLYNSLEGMRRVLIHPLISPDKKNAIINKVLGTRVSPIILRFLKLLINKNRVMYLTQIADAYHFLSDQARGIARVKVKSYLPMPTDQLKVLEQKMLTLTSSQQVILEPEVDPSLLGGITVQVGDSIIDGSVTGRLRELREQLITKS